MINLLLWFIVCVQTPNIEVVDKPTFNELMEKGYTLVDLRRPEEFAAGHIEKAENINYLAEDFVTNISKLDKTQTLLIYCRSGNRSGRAAKVMDSLGFKKIYDLKGGYLAWSVKQ